MRTLTPIPLTAEAFSPFGQVLDVRSAQQVPINEGLTTRFNDMAELQFDGDGAKPLINVFRTSPVSFPHQVRIMERHPLGSQAFYPLSAARFMVLVAPAGDTVNAADLQLFISDGQQGVNFNPNTWHHYQLALDQQSDFLVVDRGGPGNNLDEVTLVGEAQILAP